MIAAFWADTVFAESDTALRATVDGAAGFVLLAGCVDTAGESDLGDVEFVLEQLVDHFDHTFYGHGLFRDYQAAVRISRAEFGLESFAFHLVGGSAVLDSLLLIDIEDGWQQRIVLAQNQSVVKVLDH